MYKPYMIFSSLALVLATSGIIPFIRWGIIEAVATRPGTHLESIVVGAVLLIVGFLSLILGVVADLVRTNRTLLEDNLEHMKRLRYGGPSLVSAYDVSQLGLAVAPRFDGLEVASRAS